MVWCDRGTFPGQRPRFNKNPLHGWPCRGLLQVPLHGEIQIGFRNVVLFGVAGEHQRQGAVTGDVAGGAEGILQGKDGQHQARTGTVKVQHRHDQTQRRHDRTAGDAGRTHGKNTQQNAEEHHGHQTGQLTIENLADGHHKEHLRQHRAAQMDIGKQGNAEGNHIRPQGFGLAGALQRHGQRGRRRHGAHSGEIGGAVVLHHFQGIGLGVGAADTVEQGQPDIMADHHQDHHNQEDGQLFGDGALIGQGAEGAGDEDGQNGNDHLGDDFQHNLLELLQHRRNGTGAGPGGRQTHQHREHQSAHDGHNGRDIQLENGFGDLLEAVHLGDDVETGDDGVTGGHGKQRRAQRGRVGDDQGHPQHPRGIGPQLDNGRGNKSDDNQRHAEGNQLVENILDGDNDLQQAVQHPFLRDDQAQDHAQDHAHQQLEGQALDEFHTINLLVPSSRAVRLSRLILL